LTVWLSRYFKQRETPLICVCVCVCLSRRPLSEAVRPEAWHIFGLSNTQVMDVCLRLFCLFYHV
jgi:hypothetical protein